MTRPSPFGHPFLLGFDEIEQALDRVSKAANDGYPPYNIERVARTEHEPERLRITLAVAGFAEDEIELTAQQNQLVVAGKKAEANDNEGSFLHRGIANRSFERRFQLADHVRVTSAALTNGLLAIELVREVPEAMKPRKIAIGNSNVAQIEDKLAA